MMARWLCMVFRFRDSCFEWLKPLGKSGGNPLDSPRRVFAHQLRRVGFQNELKRRQVFLCADVSQRDTDVSPKSLALRSEHRRSGKSSPENFVGLGEGEQAAQTGKLPCRQLRLAASDGVFVVRADGEAVVAPENPVAHQGPKLQRDRAF